MTDDEIRARVSKIEKYIERINRQIFVLAKQEVVVQVDKTCFKHERDEGKDRWYWKIKLESAARYTDYTKER